MKPLDQYVKKEGNLCCAWPWTGRFLGKSSELEILEFYLVSVLPVLFLFVCLFFAGREDLIEWFCVQQKTLSRRTRAKTARNDGKCQMAGGREAEHPQEAHEGWRAGAEAGEAGLPGREVYPVSASPFHPGAFTGTSSSRQLGSWLFVFSVFLCQCGESTAPSTELSLQMASVTTPSFWSDSGVFLRRGGERNWYFLNHWKLRGLPFK